MQKVLIIAENLPQYERIKLAFSADENVQATAASLRQINAKNLRILRQIDLILIEEDTSYTGQAQTEHTLSFLKRTGLPIMLLPTANQDFSKAQEPHVLNLTEPENHQKGLGELLNTVRSHYALQRQKLQSEQTLASQPEAPNEQLAVEDLTLVSGSAALPIKASPASHYNDGKIAQALTTVHKISNQLREPLSNMNLAIHMLGRVQSVEERDRYLELLRQEYNRELQLLNQLDNHLQTSLPPIT